MKIRRIAAVCLALTAWGHCARAQDTPAPAPAQTEMQKWIATTDEAWQAMLKRDVTEVHLTELEKLKQQYVAALEAAVTKASSAGDLDGAVALRAEEKRFAGTNLLPEQDEPADAAAVKRIRPAVRAQITKLDKETAARTKALHARYDQFLADTQTQLTKAQRFDDALLVKARREQVAAAWLTPATGAALASAAPSAVPAKATLKPAVPAPAVSTASAFQMQTLFNKLKAAAVNPRASKAMLPKNPKGTYFVDCPKEGALLVGFDVTMGDWFGAPLISSLQPIYLTSAGKVKGELHGKKGRNPKTLEAREGYAVAGFNIHHGTFCWSIELTYMRLDPLRGTLLRTDSYESEVIGDFSDHPDHKPNKKVGGEGSPILGVFGTAESERLNTLGIIQAP
ncbi:MAG: hypothetical protein ABI318_11935 [Chthoniobacteraceae bacterium]